MLGKFSGTISWGLNQNVFFIFQEFECITFESLGHIQDLKAGYSIFEMGYFYPQVKKVALNIIIQKGV